MIWRRAFDCDAEHRRPGRLRLLRDDGDLGADQRIDQRRLAAIRRADQRDEAAAALLRGLSLSHGPGLPDALAEQHGERRRLLGRALVGAVPAFGRNAVDLHLEVKRGLWSGPSRAIST